MTKYNCLITNYLTLFNYKKKARPSRAAPSKITLAFASTLKVIHKGNTLIRYIKIILC